MGDKSIRKAFKDLIKGGSGKETVSSTEDEQEGEGGKRYEMMHAPRRNSATKAAANREDHHAPVNMMFTMSASPRHIMPQHQGMPAGEVKQAQMYLAQQQQAARQRQQQQQRDGERQGLSGGGGGGVGWEDERAVLLARLDASERRAAAAEAATEELKIYASVVRKIASSASLPLPDSPTCMRTVMATTSERDTASVDAATTAASSALQPPSRRIFAAAGPAQASCPLPPARARAAGGAVEVQQHHLQLEATQPVVASTLDWTSMLGLGVGSGGAGGGDQTVAGRGVEVDEVVQVEEGAARRGAEEDEEEELPTGWEKQMDRLYGPCAPPVYPARARVAWVLVSGQR